MGCPGGISTIRYTRLVLEVTGRSLYISSISLYISLEKGDHYYIQTRHNDLFFPLQSYSRKTLRKNAPKGVCKY